MNDIEKTQTIVKAEEVLNEVERMRLYMKTPSQAAQALIIIKKLREYADFWEEKVKGRAAEIMVEENLRELDLGEYQAIKVEPTETRKYDVRTVIEAIGVDRALALGLTISTPKLNKYIIKQGVSMDELAIINQKIEIGHRKGFIAIKAKKVKSK